MRVYTEAGVRLVGDTALARGYISYARTLLGMMKAFNQGLSVQNWRRTLPDGTDIFLSSIHGRDAITIIATPATTSTTTALSSFIFVYDDGTNAYSRNNPLILSADTYELVEVQGPPYVDPITPTVINRGDATVRNGELSWIMPKGIQTNWQKIGFYTYNVFFHKDIVYTIDSAVNEVVFGVLEKDGAWYALTYTTSGGFQVFVHKNAVLATSGWTKIDTKLFTLSDITTNLPSGGGTVTGITASQCYPCWSMSHTPDLSKVSVCLKLGFTGTLAGSTTVKYYLDIDDTTVTWTEKENSTLVQSYLNERDVADSQTPAYSNADASSMASITTYGASYKILETTITGRRLVGSEFDANGNEILCYMEIRPDLSGATKTWKQRWDWSSTEQSITFTEPSSTVYYSIGNTWSSGTVEGTDIVTVVEDGRLAEQADAPVGTTVTTDSYTPPNPALLADVLVGRIVTSVTYKLDDGVGGITYNSYPLRSDVVYPALTSTSHYYRYRVGSAFVGFNFVPSYYPSLPAVVGRDLAYSPVLKSTVDSPVYSPYFTAAEGTRAMAYSNEKHIPYYLVFYSVDAADLDLASPTQTYLGSCFISDRDKIKDIRTSTSSYRRKENPTSATVAYTTETDDDNVTATLGDQITGYEAIQNLSLLNQGSLLAAPLAIKTISYSPSSGSGSPVFSTTSTTSDNLYSYRLNIEGQEYSNYVKIKNAGYSGTANFGAVGVPSGSGYYSATTDSYTDLDYKTMIGNGLLARYNSAAYLIADATTYCLFNQSFAEYLWPTKEASGIATYSSGVLTVTLDGLKNKSPISPLSGYEIGLRSIRTLPPV